jgi:hypothetical protein
VQETYQTSKINGTEVIRGVYTKAAENQVTLLRLPGLLYMVHNK